MTVENIYGKAQDLLLFDGSTVGIPGLEEERTIEWIEDLHQMYFQEFENAGVNFPEYMKKEKGFTGLETTALAANVAAGAASFTIDSSTYLDTSGAGVIYKNNQFDIFTHSGNAAGTVTGVSGLDFAHEADEEVGKLYALPSDFLKFRKGPDHDGVRVNGVGYHKVSDLPSSRQFALHEDSSGNKYLWIQKGQTGDILVTYDRKPTTLDDASDSLDIRTPDHWYVIWGLVSFFKQIQDEDYVPQKEESRMKAIIDNALGRRSSGKKISGSNAYFKRGGSSPIYPYRFS